MRHPLTAALLALSLFVAAPGCGGDSHDEPPPPGPDAGPVDTPDLPAPSVDVAPTPDLVPPSEVVTPPDPCDDGDWFCSEDAHVLSRCEDGVFVARSCFAGSGFLCEDGECVAPWRYGAPVWSTCPDEPLATAESLAEKAAYYDDIAVRLHLHPELKWLNSVAVERVEVECPADTTPPCYAPVVPEAELTTEHVEEWLTGENDGLWSALYMAALAYRYAATGDEAALETLRVLMDGEQTRMRITGVSGLFTRTYVPPGVPGIACPISDEAYTTDVEKDDNQWVKIGESGCVRVIPHETGEWTETDHCGLEEFAGWCFLDNVSQDEYAGHMFALGTIAQIVDVPDLRDSAVDLVEQVGDHLMANDMVFTDWDGRFVEHGYMYPTSFTDAPGFSALLGYAYIQMAAYLTGRDDLDTYRRECLLQESRLGRCLPWPLETGQRSFLDYLSGMMLYVGLDHCQTNFNNISMLMTGFHTAIWLEEDPALRAALQEAFDLYVMRDRHSRIPAIVHQNSWYNFIWAAKKALGPESDGPAFDDVHDAICSLKQFPASQARPTRRPSETYPHFCDARLGRSFSEEVIPVAERCLRRFFWWSGTYRRRDCEAEPWIIESPADYLLAYWMGRYYGFIPPDL